MGEEQNFGWAIEQLKAGKKVARQGWNGKGMWLLLFRWIEDTPVPPYPYERLPFIGMKTADDKLVPWLASQADMLAEDWVEVDRITIDE